MLPVGIDSIKDLTETIALLIGTTAIIYGVFSYRVARNQFNFSVMISCIERFQEVLPQIASEDSKVRLQAVGRYIDLCNEELFYFKYHYVPEEVVDEWIEGMAFYLPWFNKEGRNLNPKALQEIEQHNMMHDYPRVRRAFEVTRTYDFDSLNERMKLIDVVRENLKRNHYHIP
jgi:hypothetical protein